MSTKRTTSTRDDDNSIAQFITYMKKKLPDDVEKLKFKEWRPMKRIPLAKTIYETMHKNMDLAYYSLIVLLVQDTGVLQFWVSVGSNYPLVGELEEILCAMPLTRLHTRCATSS